MVAAAGEADTTARGTMLTKTAVEGVPVLTRKLSKNRKASKPDATEDTDARLRLVRSLFIYMYTSRQQQSGRELQTEPQTVADGLFKDYNWPDCFAYAWEKNEDSLCGYSRDDCLALYEGYQTEADSDLFCQEVSPVISAYILDKLPESVYSRYYTPGKTYEECMDVLQCPSTYCIVADIPIEQCPFTYSKTPSMCCDYFVL